MGLLEEIEAVANPEFKCKFARWFEKQDSKYQTEIVEALDGDYPTMAIWKVLTDKHGPFVSATILGRHRRGGCACGAE